MKTKKSPSDLQKKFIVRLPDGMYERIDAAARRHGRSKTAEIVDRLKASFEAEEKLEKAPPRDVLEVAIKLAREELDTLQLLYEALEKKK
jgi:plasmid stability protein